MRTLILLPGVKLQSYIKQCVPQQSVPGSVPPFVSMSVQESSEVTGLYHTNDIWHGGWSRGEASLRCQLDAKSSAQSNRYCCRHSASAISTVYTFESPTLSWPLDSQPRQLNSNNVKCEDHILRWQCWHAWHMWNDTASTTCQRQVATNLLFAYQISSFPRKRLPLQHVKTRVLKNQGREGGREKDASGAKCTHYKKHSHSNAWAWHAKNISELQQQYRGMKKQRCSRGCHVTTCLCQSVLGEVAGAGACLSCCC